MLKKSIFIILLYTLLVLSCNKFFSTRNNEMQKIDIMQEIDIILEEWTTPEQSNKELNELNELNEGINITDVLNIRNLPSINGKIIGNIVFGDIFQVYDEKGTGVIENDLLDLWYKISETEEKWVNAFYVRKFPFYIASDSFEQVEDNNGYRIDRSTIIININGHEVKNDVRYLKMNVFSLKEDKLFTPRKDIRIEPIKEFYYIYEEIIFLIDNKFNNIIEFIFDIYYNKKHEVNASVAYKWEHYETKDYDLTMLELKYGIKVGMFFNEVIELLGNYYYFDDCEGAYIYSNMLSIEDPPSGPSYLIDFKILFYLDEQNIINTIIYRNPVIK